MKRVILCLTCFLFGVGLGWYFGYARPVARQYRYLRDHWHMTDHELAEMGAQMPQLFESVKRGDDLATTLAAISIIHLKRGEIDRVINILILQIASYYHRYHEKGGDPKVLKTIEDAAKQDSDVAAEIEKHR